MPALNPFPGSGMTIAGPWSGPLRLAVIDPWFPVRGARSFEMAEFAALEAWRPEAIAAPLDRLRELAAFVASGACSCPPVTHGLIALARLGRPPLEQADRDLLWRAFEAPVYQQLRDWNGELLAWECEAHDGLHIETGAEARLRVDSGPDRELLFRTAAGGFGRDLATGLAASITEATCPCGRGGARLIGLRARAGLVLDELPVGA